MRLQVSMPKSFVFIFTIVLLTLGVWSNLSYGDTARPQIYWTDKGTDKIQRANLDGTNIQDVVSTGLNSPEGIAIDVTGGKIYWTDAGSGKIQRANLNGANVQDIVSPGWLGGTPTGIALDVAGGKIYWTNWFAGTIQRANLNGSNIQNIVTEESEFLEGIALDVAGGKIYWTSWLTDKIRRANLNGSNIQDIVSTELDFPQGIALDITGGKIYWTSRGLFAGSKIRCANLDGSNIQDIVSTGLDSPVGIALDVASGKVYWTDTGTGKIQRANLNGSNIQDIVTGLKEPNSIAFVEDLIVDNQEETVAAAKFFSATPASGTTITTNATITLTFSSNPGDVTSSAGTVRGSGKTRTIRGPFQAGPLTLNITWTNGNGNITLRYTTVAPDIEPAKVTGGTVRDGDEDVDPEEINGDGKIEVTFSEEVAGNIALQTEGGKDVGWIGKIEGSKGTLELVRGKEIGAETTYVIKGKVSDAAGNETEVDITFTTGMAQEDIQTTPDTKSPAVEGASAYLSIYWIDDDANSILWANLDGTNIQGINTNVYPHGIALDAAGGKIYWTDTIRDKIQRANLDGSNVQDVITRGLDSPGGIALDVAGGKMYWTSLWGDKIRRANLDGSNIQDLVTTGLDGPWDIALDVADRKMYWTNRWEGKIQRANLNGSNVQDIVTDVYPHSLALDVAGGKVYWTDWNRAKIQRANLNGRNIQDLVTTGLKEPSGLALDVAGGKMYWTDTARGKIQYANLDGSNVQNIFTGLWEPVGIALGTTSPGVWDLDVTKDGKVTHLDIIEIGKNYGKTVAGGANPRADVNGDGKVDINDLIAVARAVDAAAAAPALVRQSSDLPFTAQALEQWIREAKHQNLDARGIAVLEHLLAALAASEAPPKETALLPNYPNPFNPETWLPYQLAQPADVTLTIYTANGAVVRTLALGHQPAGMYQSRARAAYWDGRNILGEPVASGVYFYTLTAGEFTATRKLLIRK